MGSNRLSEMEVRGNKEDGELVVIVDIATWEVLLVSLHFTS